jgi:glycerophosphoryl diester phosphodiesterase
MPDVSAVLRIGHKGAHLIAPGNTTASFDAALAHGVDMIEFDILPADPDRPADSRLVLAHDYTEGIGDAVDLDVGLAHLASGPFSRIALDVDLKLPGYEDRVVAALRAHGLLDRTLVSTMYMRSLIRLREIEPELKLGWSVPRIKRDYAASPLLMLPAAAAIVYLRHKVVVAARRHLAAGRCDALMVNWRLVSRRLVRVVREQGGELYVWTVDDARRIRSLEALGVTGVITNDPRLFTADRPA